MADRRRGRGRARLRRRAGRDRLPPRADRERRPDHRAHPPGLAGDVERAHRRGARARGRDGAAEARAVLVACDEEHRPRPLTDEERAVLERAEALLSPLRVGPVELPNRIVSTAHQTTLVHDHLPTEDFVAYHEARARGGTADRPRGDGRRPVRPAHAAHAGRLPGRSPRRARTSRRGGAAARHAAVRPALPRRTRADRQPAAAAGDRALGVPSRRFHVEPRAATAADIEAILEGYALQPPTSPPPGSTASRSRPRTTYLAAPVLHAGAEPPRRRVGGAARFVLAVLDAVRAAAPGSRSACGSARTREAARAVVGELAGHVDYVSVALGESSTYLGSAGIVPPPPIPENAIAEHAAGFRIGAAAGRHDPHRRPGRGRPADRRRGRRRRRDDPRADRRSGPAAQGAERQARGRPPLHRLQRLHRALPRGHRDRMHRRTRARDGSGPVAACGESTPRAAWSSSARGRPAWRRPPRRARPATR